jgi:hypothetical protein
LWRIIISENYCLHEWTFHQILLLYLVMKHKWVNVCIGASGKKVYGVEWSSSIMGNNRTSLHTETKLLRGCLKMHWRMNQKCSSYFKQASMVLICLKCLVFDLIWFCLYHTTKERSTVNVMHFLSCKTANKYFGICILHLV